MKTTLENETPNYTGDVSVLTDDGFEMVESENDTNQSDVNQTDEHFYSNVRKINNRQKFESVFNSGIQSTDSIIHFGGADINDTLLQELISVEGMSENKFNLQYTLVDADRDRLDHLISEYANYSGGIALNFEEDSIQSKLDSIDGIRYDWVLITNIFNKNRYKEKQLEFVDKIVSTCFNFTDKGIIITFDDSKSDEETYNIRYLISYIQEYFNRYRIEKLNETTYVITLYTYFLSTK